MSLQMEEWPRRHRITVDEYHRMAEVGLLAPDARVELIEGEIIDMGPISLPHGSVVDRLNRIFVRAVGDAAIVRVQGSVRLSRYSEPQPDLVLLRPRDDFYASAWASPADMLLAVEVSQSSLQYDLRTKVPLYARSGVPEAWIFDLVESQLWIFRQLAEGEYTNVTQVRTPRRLPVPGVGDVFLDLSALFPA